MHSEWFAPFYHCCSCTQGRSGAGSPCISSQHTIKTHTYNIFRVHFFGVWESCWNPHRTDAYSSEPGFKPTNLPPHCVAHLEWGNCQTSLSLYILAAALIISSDRLYHEEMLYVERLLFTVALLNPLPPQFWLKFSWMFYYFGFNQYILIVYFINKCMNSESRPMFSSNQFT